MNLLSRHSRPLVEAALFIEEVRRGHLWLPGDMSDCGPALIAAVHEAKAHNVSPLYVHVDTDNGDSGCWRLARALEDFTKTSAHTVALVAAHNRAYSAGLIVLLACQRRVCNSRCFFGYHGSSLKCDRGEDQRKAAWFAERTTLPEAEWLAMAEDGELRKFGPEQALAWGVVHEVTDE